MVNKAKEAGKFQMA